MLDRWMQLASGKKFYPFNPHPNHIDINDIAHALSNICRFGGHTSSFYSVAQHSVYVSLGSGHSDIEQLWGLLHDAGEAYIGDIINPIKDTAQMICMAERDILRCVADRFDLPYTMPESVKAADRQVLITEALDLMGNPQWAKDLASREFITARHPIDRIEPWEPKRACSEFLRRYEFLTEGR